MIELTQQQSEAKDKIIEWFNDSNKKQTFTLSGYAGTGKTFLINYIINDVLELEQDEVAFVTPTGKAASVLIQRGQDATTIHRLIYIPEMVIDKTASEKAGIDIKKLKFNKKSDIGYYKLIILDEISMVNEYILKDLLSFGIPVLCTGDSFQLPAIGVSNDLLDNPDHILTDVVRQSKDNTIVQIATKARNGENIEFGNYGDVVVVDYDSLTDETLTKLLKSADQIIVGTNATRNDINNQMRRLNGIDIYKHPLPLDGEKLICTSNNWEEYLDNGRKFNLVNGIIGYAKDVQETDLENRIGVIKFRAEFLDEWTDKLPFDTGIFRDNEFKYDKVQRVNHKGNDIYTVKKKMGKFNDSSSVSDFLDSIKEIVSDNRDSLGDTLLNEFEFGYAVTAHKMQGSEFDNIIVFDESYVFPEPDRWLYTAITRAKKKLIIIR